MTCREFWNALPETQGAHAHLAECSECSARMDQRRELAAGLRAVAASMNRMEAPGRVETRLLAAFQAHNRLPRQAPARRPAVPLLTWTLAAAAMIAAGVLIVRERQPATRPLPVRGSEIALASSTQGAIEAAEDGFLPLPGAAELPLAEDLDMVSVELPRSAMIQVGIAVSPERADERVLADVMVGADGMARAVRFHGVESSD